MLVGVALKNNFISTVEPRLSGPLGTGPNSPDNQGPDNRGTTVLNVIYIILYYRIHGIIELVHTQTVTKDLQFCTTGFTE